MPTACKSTFKPNSNSRNDSLFSSHITIIVRFNSLFESKVFFCHIILVFFPYHILKFFRRLTGRGVVSSIIRIFLKFFAGFSIEIKFVDVVSMEVSVFFDHSVYN